MIRKGMVTSIDTGSRRARVTFFDIDDVVTGEIPYAEHVSPQIGDAAAVAFFSRVFVDALIIAVRRGGG